MTQSSCSLPTCLCLLEKRNKLRLFCGAQVFFFSTPPLKRDSHLTVASCLPPFDRKTLKNCACSADPGLFNETKGSWFTLSCFFLYMRVFHFVIKKKEKGPETGFLSFLMILTFFSNIWIPIITSLAIHYSQNVFRGFPILVCIGVQVFFRGFIFHSSSRTWLALALASVWPKKNIQNLHLFCRSKPPQWN